MVCATIKCYDYFIKIYSQDSGREGFDSSSLHLIPFEQLNSALVFYWRCLCKYFHTREEDSTTQLERVTPTLSQFCDYMQRCVITAEFVSQFSLFK